MSYDQKRRPVLINNRRHELALKFSFRGELVTDKALSMGIFILTHGTKDASN